MFASPAIAAGRSDLEPARVAGRTGRVRSLSARLAKLRLNGGHALRIITSFGPTGELFRARQLKLPIADDIKAQL
jgi:hypothetical protein